MSFMLHEIQVTVLLIHSSCTYIVYTSSPLLLCKEVTRRGRDEGEKKEVVIIK